MECLLTTCAFSPGNVYALTTLPALPEDSLSLTRYTVVPRGVGDTVGTSEGDDGGGGGAFLSYLEDLMKTEDEKCLCSIVRDSQVSGRFPCLGNSDRSVLQRHVSENSVLSASGRTHRPRGRWA